MENIGIGAIIFIVFIVISIAQKIKEHADSARARRQLPQSKPGEMSEEARGKIYGEEAPVREATPKAVPRRREPVAQAQELMEALFGAERIEVVEEEVEAEWTPLTPDARPELPRRVPPPPPPIRRQVVAQHVESRVQHEPVHEGATTREESILHRQAQAARHREREAQKRSLEQRQEQRPREGELRRRKTPKVRPTALARRRKRERLFSSAHEVRKAIVFAEILGLPKAFKDR